jgi:hypothetical protein
MKVSEANSVSDKLVRRIESEHIMAESCLSTSAIPEIFEEYKMPKSNWTISVKY